MSQSIGRQVDPERDLNRFRYHPRETARVTGPFPVRILGEHERLDGSRQGR